jgi:glycosyltransferase involved in cell wall biosynthesis
MYNESSKGNLVRCLENVKQFCDHLVIYDDGSTDNSVEVALRYTPHVIMGQKNEFNEELRHKQALMDYAKSTMNDKIDYFFWIDLDEILDRRGIDHLQEAIEQMEAGGYNGASFHQLNLWRGHNWARLDGNFGIGWFTRLWKNLPALNFLNESGLHKRIFPLEITKVVKMNFRLIHYGFADYGTLPSKCFGLGKTYQDTEYFFNNFKRSWCCDESTTDCRLVHPLVFPEINLPVSIVEAPLQRDNFKSMDQMILYLKMPPQVVNGATYETSNCGDVLDWYQGTNKLLLEW